MRPDGVVAWGGPTADGLDTALTHWFGPPRSPGDTGGVGDSDRTGDDEQHDDGTDVGGTDVGGTDVGGTDVGGTDVGGSPACFAHLLCPECSAVPEDGAARCWRCGTTLPARDA
ncbi:hypothetical protein TOK_6093 [Pseudonocardia sp. N23]|nr:hypothetical protein [Pseudonocardia sp. N23]GAY11583.1 hypothetical protein TOK_6093 [Pseudonocardia sp. N23]